MRRLLIVFDDGSDTTLDLQAFVDSLDPGVQMWSMDGHVCFLKTSLSVSDVTDIFTKIVGSRLFLVTDMTSSDYAGRMPGRFWDFMKSQEQPAAAE